MDNYTVYTGDKTPKIGIDAKAIYDHHFYNGFTNKHLMRESKFNNSNFTKNQRAARYLGDYPVEIDRTTSEGLGNYINIFLQTVGGSSRPALTDFE